ncbi:hypothetical protein [Novipirellula sp.]|uniref:hypothetical protein n=1 Tax=Novipirellula sp. TaxID=2795430 RepID=UPI003563055F
MSKRRNGKGRGRRPNMCDKQPPTPTPSPAPPPSDGRAYLFGSGMRLIAMFGDLLMWWKS